MISKQTLPYFIAKDRAKEIVTLILISESRYEPWLRKQDEFTINWLMSNNYKCQKDNYCLIPSQTGAITKVLVGIDETPNLWSLAHLPMNLPVGFYALEKADESLFQELALGWGLAAYSYNTFKQPARVAATLVIPENQSYEWVQAQLQALYLVRDLINTPAENMGPEQLSFAAETLARHYQAEFSEIVGDDLLRENYPAIHAVGRGSCRLPRLIELGWGDIHHPKVTLVGKGVCFDSGGLDLKPAIAMLLMKKDMAGAAHVLGLASLIMDVKLPVRLRVLIPAVENAISGSAYRPGDVIVTRKGLTVEIGNTDAEGRVILSDALAEASREKPDLIIDFTTLTGAARVALGTEIPVMFSNDQENANLIAEISEVENDLVWQLPLHASYRSMLDSNIADMNNCSESAYAGSILAALFLQSFVDENIPWIHFDLMAWNVVDKPGRPRGGEAMGLRAVFQFLKTRYQDQMTDDRKNRHCERT